MSTGLPVAVTRQYWLCRVAATTFKTDVSDRMRFERPGLGHTAETARVSAPLPIIASGYKCIPRNLHAGIWLFS